MAVNRVEGNNGANLIDDSFLDDPENDKIDNTANVVDAGGGDDTVKAKDGDDTVYAGSGNDSVKGEDGDDVIFGDSNFPGGKFDDGATVRESFEWDKAPDPNGSNPIEDGDPLSHFTQNTGNVDVTFKVTAESNANIDHEFSDEDQYVGGIDDGSESIDDESGLSSDLSGDSHGSASYELGFSTPVENADFRINDIDGSSRVTVRAFDAMGNEIPVTITAGSELTEIGANTVRTKDLGEYDDPDEEDFSARVQIDGPVSSITIDHSEGDFNSGIWVTDIYYDVPLADTGAAGDDTLLGGDGDDMIYGEGGDDSIEGGAGADTLSGGEGTNILRGGDEDDIFIGGSGADSFDGGRDEDVIDYSGSGAAVNVDLSTSSLSGGDAGNDTIIGGIDGVIGSDFDDTLTGFDQEGTSDPDVFSNFFDGGAGNDKIDGRGGDDVLIGGDGRDTVDGGAGDDFIDTSAPLSAAPLPDLAFPGLFAADPDPDNDRDLVFGGGGNDTILTGDDADTIDGGAGNDSINAGIDADDVTGGAGDDTIIGGEGSDNIEGNGGDDLIFGGLDPIFPDSLNIPDDNPSGPDDPVTDNGRDLIFGGDGNDTIFGQDDDDTIHGGAGNDSIDGGIDDDLLFGDDGDDTILGGDGDDTITGGAGADSLSGGDGRDTFIIGSVPDADGDIIDGGSGGDDVDTLDLSGLGPFVRVGETTDPDGNSTSGTINFLDSPGGTVTGSLTYSEIENIVPCFTPGTRIATPRGEVAVEDLREGDRVITRDNGLQEVRWVGSRGLGAADLMAAPHLRPVRIRAGALGHGLPEHDMLVSPQHRVLLTSERAALYFGEREVLAAARHLTGMEGIAEARTTGTTYIHFMCDRHEVVLSDGAWTESFQPGEQVLDGMGDAPREEIFALFPELREQTGVDAYQAARRSLKRHEARLLVE